MDRDAVILCWAAISDDIARLRRHLRRSGARLGGDERREAWLAIAHGDLPDAQAISVMAWEGLELAEDAAALCRGSVADHLDPLVAAYLRRLDEEDVDEEAP